ncbi:unnamed protein product [Rhodiola kirilowii]
MLIIVISLLLAMALGISILIPRTHKSGDCFEFVLADYLSYSVALVCHLLGRFLSVDASGLAKAAQTGSKIDKSNQDSKVFTAAEVAVHNKRTDCWIIIKDRICDVTSYVEEHPEGDAILAHAGDDSTEGFFGWRMSGVTRKSDQQAVAERERNDELEIAVVERAAAASAAAGGSSEMNDEHDNPHNQENVIPQGYDNSVVHGGASFKYGAKMGAIPTSAHAMHWCNVCFLLKRRCPQRLICWTLSMTAVYAYMAICAQSILFLSVYMPRDLNRRAQERLNSKAPLATAP